MHSVDALRATIMIASGCDTRLGQRSATSQIYSYDLEACTRFGQDKPKKYERYLTL
jgi:hypothetical protein